MRKIHFYSLIFTIISLQKIDAQCIKDIQSLINMPAPCFFVGNIDFDNPDCFDIFASTAWRYTWKIKTANDGELIATYEGPAFQHTFPKFGGYEFCLEVDKDNDPYNLPDIVDCVTYTTCEICTEDSIKVDYIKCPNGPGCNINLAAKIPATNDVGLKPTAKFVITYLPTPQELLGGVLSYDIVFDDIDVEYNAQTDSISISQNLTVPFKRGCFKPTIIFKLKDGYGAHGSDGMSCTEVELFSEHKFRCIACANNDGSCIASVVASQISNEEGTCNVFTSCNQLREFESENDGNHQKKVWSVSPNPASEYLHIDLPESESELQQVLLFNSIGQMVMQMSIPKDETHADFMIRNLQPGLYLVTVTTNGELTHSAQVVISNR